ncbi:hypothetical protein SAMN05877753_102652 [Bacillus oleivorans]|uniref:Lipoprotein n=1 Tax=Bacillus oleivorans TaxID=1448271 RepID=A0A285CMM3_9BACI|nr:hypothetical protein SAMN05877753_102652 [Bacillus oleivorans]
MKTKKLLIILTWIVFFISGCSNKEEPPEAIVKINNVTVETEKGSYQWLAEGIFTKKLIHADAAPPLDIAKNMNSKIVKESLVANIEFNDGSQPQWEAYLWGEGEIEKILSSYDKELTLPTETGRHVIEIRANWANGNASYVFVVEVPEP